ncbi:hypothetical protein Tco_0124196, partial [Tanacetum coccineum]
AWLKSVSLKQRFPSKSFSKKHRVHKDYVSKQGRKFAKGESSVQRDPLFDKLPEDTADHMETENARDKGRIREMVDEDKPIVSTDRTIISTDGSKVSTEETNKGTKETNEGTKEHTVEHIEGTKEQVESTDGHKKGIEEEIATQGTKEHNIEHIEGTKEQVESTDGHKKGIEEEIATQGTEEHTVEHIKGTEEQVESTDGHKKGTKEQIATQVTQASTSKLKVLMGIRKVLKNKLLLKSLKHPLKHLHLQYLEMMRQ